MLKPATQERLENTQIIIRVLIQGKPAQINLPGYDPASGEFKLPIPPQSITYEDAARMSIYAHTGITSRSESRGVDPPTIIIAGTFAQRTRMKLDGFEWQRALEGLFQWYFTETASAGSQRRPLPTLEFHDVSREQHWIIEPLGTPWGRQDASTPTREQFNMRFRSLRRIGEPPVIISADPNANVTAAVNLCPFYSSSGGCASGQEFHEGCPFREGTA